MIGLIMLVAFVLYLLVAISVTSWLARIPKRVPYKWLTALLTLAVFALIPTWDEILGRMYFKHLCETEGGVRVYKTVELGPEYWDSKGDQLLIKDEIPIVSGKHLIAERYKYDTDLIEITERPGRIKRDQAKLVDIRVGDTLALRTNFIYFGGWLINSTGLLVTGKDCRDYGHSIADFRGFLHEVFTPLNRHRR